MSKEQENSDVSVKVYQSPEKAFWVNSFLIETAGSVVVIDTQFLVSTAQELKRRIEAIGKPLSAVIVSHPHPDHFNGTIVLSEGNEDLPVYATQATLDGIKATEASKREFWTKSYGDDYPRETFFPNRTLQPQDEITIDGVRFVIDELGAGESLTNTVIYLPEEKILFASDLIYDGAHPWLAEGRSAAWLKHLNYLKTAYSDAETVYAGHGGKTTLAAVDEQIKYIEEFSRLVKNATANGKTLGEEEKNQIAAATKAQYQNLALEFLIDSNADGLATEFAEK